MKIILTGTTGFVGLAVLQYCINSPYIHHIYSLTRSPLPAQYSSNPKVTEIIHRDFTSWPGPQLQTLRDAGVNGCIWCLGGALTRFSSHDEAMTANVSYAIQAAEAFVKDLIPRPSDVAEEVVAPNSKKGSQGKGRKKQPFRLVYMSVAWAEQNQFRSLWSQAQTRKMKGAAEKGLFEIADGDTASGMLEVYCFRLGRVLPGGQTMGNVATQSVSTCVSVERVAKRAHDYIVDGGRAGDNGEIERIVENATVLGEDWADINTIS